VRASYWRGAQRGVASVTPAAGKDLFVHHSSIARNGLISLTEGEKVSYEIEQGATGLPAANVRVL
jgi:CspA family cold shock protein